MPALKRNTRLETRRPNFLSDTWKLRKGSSKQVTMENLECVKQDVSWFLFEMASLSTFPSCADIKKETETKQTSWKDPNGIFLPLLPISPIQIIQIMQTSNCSQPRNQNSGLPVPGRASGLPVPFAIRSAAIWVGFTGKCYSKMGHLKIGSIYSNYGGIVYNNDNTYLKDTYRYSCFCFKKARHQLVDHPFPSFSILFPYSASTRMAPAKRTHGAMGRLPGHHVPVAHGTSIHFRCCTQFWRNLWL